MSQDDTFQGVIASAYDHLYRGAVVEAAAAFKVVLAYAPNFGEAWAALGETTVVPGEVAGLMGRAIRCDSGEWRWRLAWAGALLHDDPASAVAAFKDAVAARPDSGDARRGLARALARSDDRGAAVDEYRELAALGKASPDDLCDHAALLIVMDQPERAAEALAPHTTGDAPDPNALAVMAEAWAALGERSRALRTLDRALALGAVATPAVTALHVSLEAPADGGEAAPPPPTRAYVRALFDRYAGRFDHDLVDRLGYVGPSLLLTGVTAVRPDIADARTLDLGCGTGLAGVAFRPLAATLHGVDLSAAMVARAESRGLYDRLVVGDLLSALRESEGAWDLVVAADVFIYLGDLALVFQATARALAPGGLFAFTVEALEAAAPMNGETGLALLPSRRYAHGAEYLLSGLAEAGLEVALMDRVTLRWDRGEPMIGHRVVARFKTPV